MYPVVASAFNQPAPEPSARDDLRFLYDQARRYVDGRAWERLAPKSFYLDLKVGSWEQVCAQLFRNGPANVMFLFQGHRDMLDLRKSGLAEPPTGTIMIEFLDELRLTDERWLITEASEHGWPADLRPLPVWRTITPQGWTLPDRRQTRIAALAFAGLSAYAEGGAEEGEAWAAGPEAEAAGDLILPGGVRGRYRVREAPKREGDLVPMVGIPRFDLFDGTDVTFSGYTMDWPSYKAIRSRALYRREAEIADGIPSLPLAIYSGTDEEARLLAERIRAADPLGIMFGEMGPVLGMVLAGTKESYVLLQADGSRREQLMAWWYGRKPSGGAYALVVTDTHPDRRRWEPKTVHAIFEFR